ncbi:MAG TPA: diacylglycerol kinase, partial [Acidimicrobiaceae bacterium]|nr:diacylglycerol kinase [Acidimicrobiaceae bacterium]
MKVLLIVNPSASSVTARTRIVIQKALSADHRLEVAATTRRGHATRL